MHQGSFSSWRAARHHGRMVAARVYLLQFPVWSQVFPASLHTVPASTNPYTQTPPSHVPVKARQVVGGGAHDPGHPPSIPPWPPVPDALEEPDALDELVVELPVAAPPLPPAPLLLVPASGG